MKSLMKCPIFRHGQEGCDCLYWLEDNLGRPVKAICILTSCSHVHADHSAEKHAHALCHWGHPSLSQPLSQLAPGNFPPILIWLKILPEIYDFHPCWPLLRHTQKYSSEFLKLGLPVMNLCYLAFTKLDIFWALLSTTWLKSHFQRYTQWQFVFLLFLSSLLHLGTSFAVFLPVVLSFMFNELSKSSSVVFKFPQSFFRCYHWDSQPCKNILFSANWLWYLWTSAFIQY